MLFNRVLAVGAAKRRNPPTYAANAREDAGQSKFKYE